MKKRQFIKDVLLTTLAAPIGLTGLAQTFKKNASLPANELAKVEDFWLSIRNQYLLKPVYINLENGYYSNIPQPFLYYCAKNYANFLEIELPLIIKKTTPMNIK